MVQFERDIDCHVASFSANDAVYKVQGQPEVIPRFYPEFAEDDFAASRIIAHNRYSTNTYPTFSRVQPFSLLGHNGEINTIAQLREQCLQLGLPITHEGSDSQDLNRLLEGLVFKKGLSLLEAVEFALPPILGEVHRLPAHLQDLYVHYREALGPYAQGPVALATRAQNEMVFAVDAMGLRPLWWIETDDWYVVSSEPGIIEVGNLTCDPRPLGPGEKMAVILDDDGVPHALDYPEVQQQVYERAKDRGALPHGETRARLAGGLDPTILADDGNGGAEGARHRPQRPARCGLVDRVRQAPGRVPRRAWCGAGRLARLGRPAGTVHADPDAALGLPAGNRRGRDQSGHRPGARGRALLHPRRPRPPSADPGRRDRAAATLRAAHADPARRPAHRPRPLAAGAAPGRRRRRASPCWTTSCPPGATARSGSTWPTRPAPTMRERVAELSAQAVAAVRGGAEVIVLHDMGASAETRVCDPMLAVAAVDKALREQYQDDGDSIRRNVSLLLQSAGIRNVHDVMVALGLGAQALIPYAMLEYAVQANPEPAVAAANLLQALQKGIEKVLSTLGIHELRGYARLMSAIGVQPEILEIIGMPGFVASDGPRPGLRRARGARRARPEDPRRRGEPRQGQAAAHVPEGLEGARPRRQLRARVRGVRRDARTARARPAGRAAPRRRAAAGPRGPARRRPTASRAASASTGCRS